MSYFRSSVSLGGLRRSRLQRARRLLPEELEARWMLVCPGGATFVPAGLIPAQTLSSGDFCWDDTSQPYQLLGDVRVNVSASVTIEPGVRVERLQPDAALLSGGAGSLIIEAAEIGVDLVLGSATNFVVTSFIDDATIPRCGCQSWSDRQQFLHVAATIGWINCILRWFSHFRLFEYVRLRLGVRTASRHDQPDASVIDDQWRRPLLPDWRHRD